MATIIYATVDKVLMPVFGIDPSYAPPLSALAMGVITLIYTSLGGLQAVVMTDVIQTVILILGVLLSIALITLHFGGVGWFPTQWCAHWEPFRLDISLQNRFTLGNAMVMVFVWYICTAGSDQMAIQRYLATRDVQAARKTFLISLVVNFLVQAILALLGLALLAYFTSRPDELPDGVNAYTGADQLFARYIVLGLPIGIAGLVAAGLMSAAMSSLSSGMSSSCSVLTEDLLNRFISTPSNDAATMRRAKLVSVVIGVFVVLVSLCLAGVQGNLLDVTVKVVNLFVAPLFVLFVLALFVPWATSLGGDRWRPRQRCRRRRHRLLPGLWVGDPLDHAGGTRQRHRYRDGDQPV